MSLFRWIAVAVVAPLAAAVAGACAVPFSEDCAGVGMYGIVAQVRTSDGTPAANGATLIATDGAFADTVGPVIGFPSNQGPLQITGAENRGGTYTVRITKPFWTSVTRTVRVPGGTCGHVDTQTIDVTLDKLPGAPPLRSVAVQPRSTRFSFCGSGILPQTYIDADAGQPTGVVWTSSDKAVAYVDSTGILRDGTHGTAIVRATSVADPSIYGEVRVVVDPAC